VIGFQGVGIQFSGAQQQQQQQRVHDAAAAGHSAPIDCHCIWNEPARMGGSGCSMHHARGAGCGAGYIHDSWLGQYEAGDRNYRRSEANATAILFDDGQHDSDLLNVIVFSGKIGVNSSNVR
jgi:hypothetical protein